MRPDDNRNHTSNFTGILLVLAMVLTFSLGFCGAAHSSDSFDNSFTGRYIANSQANARASAQRLELQRLRDDMEYNRMIDRRDTEYAIRSHIGSHHTRGGVTQRSYDSDFWNDDGF